MSEKEEIDSPRVASIHPGEDELPAVRGPVPYKVWLVQSLYLMERAAFYGLSQPLQNYLQLSQDDPVRPGGLGLGQARAVLVLYVWFAYSYSTPLLGGLLADCWLGRRKTIQIGFLIYALGLIIITVTAFTQRSYGTGGFPGFIVGMLLVGAGTGTAKPNITVFLIDQLPEEEPKVVKLKNGKSAVTSRELTIRLIYNVNYWCINVGALFGIVTTNVELHAGFGFAFLIPLGLIVAAAAGFQAAYLKFETAPSSGNAIANVFNALRRRRDAGHPTPDQTTEVARQSSAQQEDGSPTPDQDDAAVIADAKRAIRACLVFLPFPALFLAINLMDTTLVAQAGTMRTNGLPNDFLFSLNPISVLVFLPFFQNWIYPALAKSKIDFSPKHRVGAGLFCAALAIGYAAGIQHLIYITGPCFDRPLKCLSGGIPNDVSVGAQTPIYAFLGWAEILAIVSGTELAYSRAPASMKSIVQALFNMFSALGSVLGIAVSFASYDPNMVIVYGAITGLLLFSSFGLETAILVRGK